MARTEGINEHIFFLLFGLLQDKAQQGKSRGNMAKSKRLSSETSEPKRRRKSSDEDDDALVLLDATLRPVRVGHDEMRLYKAAQVGNETTPAVTAVVSQALQETDRDGQLCDKRSLAPAQKSSGTICSTTITVARGALRRRQRRSSTAKTCSTWCTRTSRFCALSAACSLHSSVAVEKMQTISSNA